MLAVIVLQQAGSMSLDKAVIFRLRPNLNKSVILYSYDAVNAVNGSVKDSLGEIK